MKNKLLLPLICVLLHFYGCEEESKWWSGRDRQITKEITGKIKEPYILSEKAFFLFRRSYFLTEEMKGVVPDGFMTRNPEPCFDFKESTNIPFYEDLMKSKYILNNNLNLSEIDTLLGEFYYQYFPGIMFSVKEDFIGYMPEIGKNGIRITFRNQAEIVLEDTLELDGTRDFIFFTDDLNNDGKQELLTIERWYIVNGDNFDLRIYELETEGVENAQQTQ